MFGTDKKPIRVSFDSRNAWLSERGSGIGSSEIATIVGLNPWQTRYQLWLQKTGQTPPTVQNFAMKAGHYLEDAVSRFFEDESGREVIKSSAEDVMYIHPEKQYLRATPDRLFWLPNAVRNDKNKGVLECKTTQMQIDAADIPKLWFCQLQYQQGIMQREQGSLAWLSAGREFGFSDFDFVPDFFEWLVEEAEKFWVDNIVGGKMPELVNAVDVMAVYSRHTEGKNREITPELHDIYLELKAAKGELKDLETKVSELENELKVSFLDAEALTFNGQTVATWKATKDTERFDAKAFQEAEPLLYQKYVRIAAGSRRLLLK
jgi:putative phage-type endonuclease